MAYQGVTLKKSLDVGKIYSIHYFEYMNDFSFAGESHNFWEFVCVDKGEVGVTANGKFTKLEKGDIVFYQPNEFHDVKANGNIAPNLVVVSFDCESEEMDYFRNQILKIDEIERNLLAGIIIEARRCFDCRLDDPYMQNMPQKEPDMFGAEQLIKLSLEQFLIHLLRRHTNAVTKTSPPKATKKKSDSEIYHRIKEYLESNLSSHLTLEKICRDNLIGRSQLQRIIKQETSLGVIEYFSQMKINAAKELIRTNHMNFSQIAESLGYTSIHYFSRQFKKTSGMTPTEYASSIKAMAEGGFSS